MMSMLNVGHTTRSFRALNALKTGDKNCMRRSLAVLDDDWSMV